MNDTDSTIVKDAFEVMSVTYDAEIELDYDTGYITIRAIDGNGDSVAEVSFHRYKDAPMLAVHKMTMADMLLSDDKKA